MSSFRHFATLPNFAALADCPCECCDLFLRSIEEATQCDFAELHVFVPGGLTCYSFKCGGFSTRHLSENSLAHRWNSNPEDNNTYVIVNDVRCMGGPVPDEWSGLKKLASIFSWGRKTLASGGRIWGTLTVAYHDPLVQACWRDVVMTCCRLMDVFVQQTRTTYLTDVCRLIYDIQRANAMRICSQLIKTFLLQHTQLVSVSIALLNAQKDRATFFIDSDVGREEMRSFKTDRLDVTENTVIHKMKMDEAMDHLTIKIPNLFNPVRQESHAGALRDSTEVSKLLSAGHSGGGNFLVMALRPNSNQSNQTGRVSGSGQPTMLGLPSATQQLQRLIGTLYLQARSPRLFNLIMAQLLSLAPILAVLLDRPFEDVDQIVQCPTNQASAGPIKKQSKELKTIRSIYGAIQKGRKSNWTPPKNPLEGTKIKELVSANTSSIVMRGEHSGKAVGMKAVPIPKNIMLSRLRLELAICVSVIHEHIVRSFAYHLDVNREQMEACCPVCTCPPSFSCQRHIILNAFVEQMETLRITAWDIMKMEHCDGTLHSLIHKRKLFQDLMNPEHLRVLVLTLIDMAKGMEYLHEIGIVHGDFKPENVLFVRRCPSDMDPREWLMKVADFGTSRLSDEERWPPPRGTLAYKPPEYMLGRAGLNNMRHEDGCAGDVYSFAITVWEMVEARIPFGDYTKDQIKLQMDVQKGHRPRFTANWPRECKELLIRMWDKEPQARPCFTEIRRELESFLR